MAAIWTFLSLMTILVLVIASIWVIIQAFQEHFLWGISVVFLHPVWIVFVVLNWQKSGRPFLLGLAAVGALLVECIIAGGVDTLFG